MVYETLDKVAFVITLVSLSGSVLLNITGVYFLYRLRGTITNQRICLINLSVMEIFSALTFLVWRFIDFFKPMDTRHDIPVTLAVYRVFVWWCYCSYLMSPFPLTLDRFMGVMFPLKYFEIYSQKRATIIMASTWILAAFLSVPFAFTDITSWLSYAPLTALCLELFVIIFGGVAYSCVGIKIRRQGNVFNRSVNETKVLKVAFRIIVTFFVLIVIPDIVLLTLAFVKPTTALQYFEIIQSISDINCLIDPIIYLWGYKSLRNTMKKTVGRYWVQPLHKPVCRSSSSTVTFSNDSFDTKLKTYSLSSYKMTP